MAFSLKPPMDIPNSEVEKRYVRHGRVSYDSGKEEVTSQPVGREFMPGERAVPRLLQRERRGTCHIQNKKREKVSRQK
jgi:hypothetical protein